MPQPTLTEMEFSANTQKRGFQSAGNAFTFAQGENKLLFAVNCEEQAKGSE